MQLLFPLASVLWVGRLTLGAVALAVAFFTAFLAHEPLLVLAKRRGARRLDELGPAAGRRFLLLAALTAVAGGVALWHTPPAVWVATAATVALGAVAMLLAVRGWERNVGGEAHAALSLVAISLPVALAARVPPWTAATLVGLWAVSMLLGTITARGVLIRKKDGGRLLRVSAGLAVAAGMGLGLAAARGLLEPWLTVGPAAFVLTTLGLALRTPSPKRMTAVGFGLVGASTVALVAFGVSLG
jgi:hypothetical protein